MPISPYPLPLPRTWSGSYQKDIRKRSVRDQVVSGKVHKLGTKGHLRDQLFLEGWGSNALTAKSLKAARQGLVDPMVEAKPAKEVGSLVTKLRKQGLECVTVEKSDRPTRWADAVWDSLTANPWWMATGGGKRSLCLVANTSDKAEAASSLFIHDVFEVLGSPPVNRMASVKRVSLVSLMSPEALNRFVETNAESLDLLVVHGGFLEPDLIHQTFGYLSALRTMFPGFLLYEAVAPPLVKAEDISMTAKRSGFPLVLGVS